MPVQPPSKTLNGSDSLTGRGGGVTRIDEVLHFELRATASVV